MGKNGGKRQTAKDEVIVASMSTHRMIIWRALMPDGMTDDDAKETLSMSSLLAASMVPGVGGGVMGRWGLRSEPSSEEDIALFGVVAAAASSMELCLGTTALRGGVGDERSLGMARDYEERENADKITSVTNKGKRFRFS